MFSLGKIARGDQSRPGHVDLPGAPHTISRLRHLFRSIRPASPVLGHAGNLGLRRGLPLRSQRYSTSVKVFAWSLSALNFQLSTLNFSALVTRHSSLITSSSTVPERLYHNPPDQGIYSDPPFRAGVSFSSLSRSDRSFRLS